MRPNLLYIGNKLSGNGNTATSIETLGRFLENEGYTIYYASSKKNKILRMFDMFFTTIRYAKKVEYVLIDVYSTQNFWFAVIISQLCRLLNLKYISKLHGGNLPIRIEKSPFFSNLLFNNAYSNIAPSKYLLEAFQKKHYRNLKYIPNTIDLKEYDYSERNINCPKLLWVRSFSVIYNPKMAIKVFYFLKKEFPEAALCMVGPDKEGLVEECKAFANDLNIEVTFTGKLEKEEWINLSSNFNVFINTTHFDNTPVSVIEAMALGLSIVSTNVGGIPYLLEHNINALLVEDNNVIAMTEAIRRLINDKELKRTMRANSRKLVEEFDWQKIKLQWFALLK